MPGFQISTVSTCEIKGTSFKWKMKFNLKKWNKIVNCCTCSGTNKSKKNQNKDSFKGKIILRVLFPLQFDSKKLASLISRLKFMWLGIWKKKQPSIYSTIQVLIKLNTQRNRLVLYLWVWSFTFSHPETSHNGASYIEGWVYSDSRPQIQ